MRSLSLALRGGIRSDQRGIATIEFLAAMVVMFFTVGGILAASFAAGVIGDRGNLEARRNVLMTAFSEAVKALPYEDCTDSDGSTYQTAFENSEALVAHDEDLRNAKDADALTIAQVNTSSSCPASDEGTQTITLEVELRGTTLERTIVKRSPDAQLQPFDTRIVNPIDRDRSNDAGPPADEAYGLLRSGVNDPQVIIGLKAVGSTKAFQYEWWCDAAHPTDGGAAWIQVNTPSGEEETSAGQQMVTLLRAIPAEPQGKYWTATTGDDSAPECRYSAPGEGSIQHDPPILVLRVTEMGSNRTAMFARVLKPLPTTTTPHNPPIAQIQVNSGGPPQCLTADPCTHNTVITFQSVAPPPPDAAIIQWEWNYGDGTPTFYCTATSGDPTANSCKNVQHTYAGGSPVAGFPVSLVVIDSYGTRSTDPPRNVVVNGPVKVRPTIKSDVTSAVTATPSSGVSPQLVQFDASGSHADGFTPGAGSPPGGIANYFWDFGTANPGDNQTGATLSKPTFTYPKSNQRETYVVTVTVTDHQGITNFATVTVVLDPLVPPIGITNNGYHKGDLPFIRNAYFDFQWQNVPRTSGDTIQYVIRITAAGGFCGFFGVGGYKDFTVNAGAAGTTQSYRAQFSSSPFAGFNGICATDDFHFTAQTVRQNPACAGQPGGVCRSDWSAPQLLDPEFF